MLQVNEGAAGQFNIKSIRKVVPPAGSACSTSAAGDGSDKPPC